MRPSGRETPAADAVGPAQAPQLVQEVLRSPGHPLDPVTRAALEPRFGHDFNRVRIHTDEPAARSARAVEALAYTVGHHVVFASGQYAPETSQGRRLLAHELAHTLQQGPWHGPPAGGLVIGSPTDEAEEEAEATAVVVASGLSAPARQRPADVTLRRQPTTPDPSARPADAPPKPDAGTGPPTTEQKDAPPAGLATASPTCQPKPLARAAFLAQPGATTNDFGLTTLDLTQVTYPVVKTIGAGPRGVKVASTTAALPAIPSVFTAAGNFLEGDITVVGQGDSSQCPSKKYPIRWMITQAGAQKIGEGEQEHCSDFQFAFDISLKPFADAVNALAASGRVFPSDKAVETALTKAVGVAPADWQNVFNCLAGKTLLRDPRSPGGASWHTPRPQRMTPNFPDCKEARAIIRDTSLPEVGKHPSSEIIKGCGEKPAAPAKAGTKAQSAPQEPGPPVEGKVGLYEETTRQDERGLPEGASRAAGHREGDREDPAHTRSILRRRRAVGGVPADEDRQGFDRRQPAAGSGRPATVPALVRAVLRSPGQPLEPATRAFFEHRFGHDFGRVRVHTGEKPDESARALGARAYTFASDVVFAHGQYRTDGAPGLGLLAHELTHVAQADRAGGGDIPEVLPLGDPGDAAEREADVAAHTVETPAAIRAAAPSRPAVRPKLQGTGDVPLGKLRFEMEKQGLHEDVRITFSPDPKGPQTKAIKFIQVVRDEFDDKSITWGKLKPEEADIDKMVTTASDREHLTQAGDTLESIALQHYGTAEFALRIFAANSQVLNLPAAARPPASSSGPTAGERGTPPGLPGEPTGEELPAPDVHSPLPSGLRLKIPGAVREGFHADILPSRPMKKRPRLQPSDPNVSPEYPTLASRLTPAGFFAPAPGQNLPGATEDATMLDQPGGGFDRVVLEFESAAHSEDLGLFYGAVRWGFRYNPAFMTERSFPDEWFQFSPRVSDTLGASVVALNKFYRNKHVVQQGETLGAISSLYFGTASRAQDIYEKNKAILKSPDPTAPIPAATELEIPGVSLGVWERAAIASGATSPGEGKATNVWERAKQK
jgi:nucleoid-associated protein YgaU